MRLSVTIVLVCLCLWASAQVSSRMLFKEANGCVCETYFDSYDPEPIGVLCIGNLMSDECEIEKYVIDWYWDDFESGIQFTTGTADTDPDVTYIHPFTGTGCIPVEPGTWIPWVRYIIVDGVKYYARHRPWEDYCVAPSAEVQEIEVEEYTCDNGTTGTYSHTVEFINTVHNPNLASRSIQFKLNEDGSTNYFVFQFYGRDISDRLTVYYCTLLDPDGVLLEDVATGVDIPASDYRGDPYLPRDFDVSSYATPFKAVINLCDYTYTLGDYLRFVITPSYIATTNKNTNWRLDMKCKSIPAWTFSKFVFTEAMRTFDLTNPSMAWNATACRWELSYGFVESMPYWQNTDVYRYMYWAQGSNWAQINSASAGGILWRWNTVGQTIPINYGTGGCLNMNGQSTLEKTTIGGEVYYILTFTDLDDYNRIVSDYNTVVASANWTNWSSDPTSIQHYKYWNFSWRTATSCGDAYTTSYFYVYRSAVFTFDEENLTISIHASTPEPNGYIAEECSTIYNTINSYCVNESQSYNHAPYFYTTNCLQNTTGNLRGLTVGYKVNKEQQNSTYYYVRHVGVIHDYINTDVADFTTSQWYETTGNAPSQYWYRNVVMGRITNMDDPANNLELYDYMDYTTGAPKSGFWSAIATLLYKKIGGYVVPAWDADAVPYNTDDMIINAGKAWKSLQDNNYEEPTAESAWWTKISSY